MAYALSIFLNKKMRRPWQKNMIQLKFVLFALQLTKLFKRKMNLYVQHIQVEVKRKLQNQEDLVASISQDQLIVASQLFLEHKQPLKFYNVLQLHNFM